VIFTLFIATRVNILASDASSGPHRLAFAGLRNAPLPLDCSSPQLRCATWLPLHFRRGTACL